MFNSTVVKNLERKLTVSYTMENMGVTSNYVHKNGTVLFPTFQAKEILQYKSTNPLKLLCSDEYKVSVSGMSLIFI